MNPLQLPEHLLLLALRDDKGSVVQCSSLALEYGLAGAVAANTAAISTST